MFKKYLLVFGVIALFLIGGCQLYEDIYGGSDGAETIDLDEIATDDVTGDVTAVDTAIDEVESEIKENNKEPEIIEVTDENQAVVIIVEETELVSLEPDANDPDGDQLIYTFTSPLDANGAWQTTYGDAGEYTITLTASDGDLSASQEALIIVNRKEETPTIDEAYPADTELLIEENSVIEFSSSASDLNSDPLDYEWKVDGEVVSDTKAYTYDLDYDSAGSHTVKLTVDDGLLEASNIWAIDVANVNRAPMMVELDNIAVEENDRVVIIVEAEDSDGDKLTYVIDSDKFQQEEDVFVWDTTYDDSGVYDVTITVTDGDLTVSQQIQIEVANVNRAPVFLGIQQK